LRDQPMTRGKVEKNFPCQDCTIPNWAKRSLFASLLNGSNAYVRHAHNSLVKGFAKKSALSDELLGSGTLFLSSPLLFLRDPAYSNL
jgi:hypothetical protein